MFSDKSLAKDALSFILIYIIIVCAVVYKDFSHHAYAINNEYKAVTRYYKDIIDPLHIDYVDNIINRHRYDGVLAIRRLNEYTSFLSRIYSGDILSQRGLYVFVYWWEYIGNFKITTAFGLEKLATAAILYSLSDDLMFNKSKISYQYDLLKGLMLYSSALLYLNQEKKFNLPTLSINRENELKNKISCLRSLERSLSNFSEQDEIKEMILKCIRYSSGTAPELFRAVYAPSEFESGRCPDFDYDSELYNAPQYPGSENARRLADKLIEFYIKQWPDQYYYLEGEAILEEPNYTKPSSKLAPQWAAKNFRRLLNLISEGEYFFNSGEYEKAFIEFEKAKNILPSATVISKMADSKTLSIVAGLNIYSPQKATPQYDLLLNELELVADLYEASSYVYDFESCENFLSLTEQIVRQWANKSICLRNLSADLRDVKGEAQSPDSKAVLSCLEDKEILLHHCFMLEPRPHSCSANIRFFYPEKNQSPPAEPEVID